nr:acyltransferase [Corynebacterium uropygiale]
MPTGTSYATGFKPTLEGLRAVAAFGIMATHVAFQTGIDPATAPGAVLARCDFFVAVFFALSAFVLWRRYRGGMNTWEYYLKRLARILPAYVCLCAVVLLCTGAPAGKALATLTLTQIYLPNSLLPGLTHAWSLSVEMAFYLVLPLFVALLGRWRPRWRVLGILVLAGVGLAWAWVPLPDLSRAGVNTQLFPPSWLPWFAVGMLAAEAEAALRGPVLSRRWRWLWWLGAGAVAWVAGQEWFGPLGLEHPSPAEFTRRVLAGTLFAVLILVPYALGEPSRALESPLMRALGRWSYGIFLWHVAVLMVVFPVLGVPYFRARWTDFLLVGVVCAVVSVVLAATSYVVVESPVVARLREMPLRSSTGSRLTCVEPSGERQVKRPSSVRSSTP